MAEDYQVNQGDCISSVAFARGFFWKTLWDHPKNSALKQQRKDPNILLAGDLLHIPDKSIGEESAATEQRHQFKLKGVPAKLKLKLMRPKPQKDQSGQASGGSSSAASPSSAGDPGISDLADPDYQAGKDEEEEDASAKYRLEIDGVRAGEGQADGNGVVEISLRPDAREGRLIVHPGQPQERIVPLELGGMDPVDEPSGVRKRLRNLGYFCEPEGPAEASDLETALRRFQDKNALPVTGRTDAATKAKLKDLHGS